MQLTNLTMPFGRVAAASAAQEKLTINASTVVDYMDAADRTLAKRSRLNDR